MRERVGETETRRGVRHVLYWRIGSEEMKKGELITRFYPGIVQN